MDNNEDVRQQLIEKLAAAAEASLPKEKKYVRYKKGGEPEYFF